MLQLESGRQMPPAMTLSSMLMKPERQRSGVSTICGSRRRKKRVLLTCAFPILWHRQNQEELTIAADLQLPPESELNPGWKNSEKIIMIIKLLCWKLLPTG